jgi:glycosyltransferase involved in cell wall biosynthesis
MSRRTVVLVPAYREEATVGDVVRGILEVGLPCCVVVDGSPDRTAERAREAGATVLELPVNLGIGGALRCGFRWAVDQGYETVVQCDADGQHPPEDIPRLVKEAERVGAHLLIGSRWLDGSGAYQLHRGRRLAMKMLSSLAHRRGGVRVHDSTSGFRVISQPLLSEFARSYPAQFMESFEVLVAAARAGYSVHEVPADFRQRQAGEASASTLRAFGQVVRVGISTIAGLHPRFTPLTDLERRQDGGGAGPRGG